MSQFDEVEFEIDENSDERVAWWVHLRWFHHGWDSAIQRFLSIAVIPKEKLQ